MHGQLHIHDPAVLVYLTDGFGSFPKKAPDQPVLWVVTPGGLTSENFPFGSVVRLR
jgi:predicted metal-dependent peptidase